MHRAATADLTVTVLYLRLFFLRLRTLRVTYLSTRNTWRACGNRAWTCSGASITWMVRFSFRPCPDPAAVWLMGTDAQSRASRALNRRGWLSLTKRATDYDVSMPCCRARSWSWR